nr:15252_t:CDS:2 [Entrophospora candida]
MVWDVHRENKSSVQCKCKRVAELEAKNMRLRQVMEENSKLKCRIEELGKNRMDTTNLVAEDSEQSCKEIGKFEKYHKMMILPMTVYPIPTLNYWRIQIPEFSLRMILTGSNKVTAQIIVDLFHIAMQKRFYAEQLLLPDITNVNLRQRTFRAKKIYALFMGIGMDRISRIRQLTYSTSVILSLTENQIQNIIQIIMCT